MAKVIAQRMTSRIDGDFVVFLIGLRVNKPWKIHKWLPVFLAMPRMLKELAANPASEFWGHVMSPRVIVQYWRSFDHLEAYARRLRTRSIGPRGLRATGEQVRAERTWESGTKPTRSGPGNTRRSTAECPHWDLARRANLSRRQDDKSPCGDVWGGGESES